MSKKYYVVQAVKKSHPVAVLGREQELELSFADGMVGVLCVFTNKKKAEKFAGKVPILTMEKVD